jgi:hypothetical protein
MPTAQADEENIQRISLLSDLQALETQAAQLDKPLAIALAKAELAAAAWGLNTSWAEKLLIESYELTFPEEQERTKLRNRPAGASPMLPSAGEVARNNIRNRVLEIAARDKAFAEQLLQLGAQELGRDEARQRYTSLAKRLIAAGETEAASSYILKAIAADPTLLNAGAVIFDVAARDRAAADKLIVQYIEHLRITPISQANNSAWRTYLFLRDLMANNARAYLAFTNNSDPQQIQPPGPVAMKAYVSYVVGSLSSLEQNEPGSAIQFRAFLLSVWLPLRQYAPELTGAFLALEKLSRRPGDDAALPTPESLTEAAQARYESRLKDAPNSHQPDELTINFAISRGDYAKARKLIDKLPDGAQKAQLTDSVNVREALALAAKDDLPAAQRLAEQLTRATSIQQVYPVLVAKCGTTKDIACATALAYQALKQLKRADAAPAVPPAGIPTSIFDTPRDLDRIVVSSFKLAAAVLPVNEELGFAVLDEAVQTANASVMDTSQGRTGFDAATFKQFAARNEARTRQAAESFKDPLRRIVALAAVYQRQAEELLKAETKNPPPEAKKLKPDAAQP